MLPASLELPKVALEYRNGECFSLLSRGFYKPLLAKIEIVQVLRGCYLQRCAALLQSFTDEEELSFILLSHVPSM
eukprot:1315120-Amphidinium_carterae.1